MPTLFIKGYKFWVYPKDARDAPYANVIREQREARVSLRPVCVQSNQGYSSADLGLILQLTRDNQGPLLLAWNNNLPKEEESEGEKKK